MGDDIKSPSVLPLVRAAPLEGEIFGIELSGKVGEIGDRIVAKTRDKQGLVVTGLYR